MGVSRKVLAYTLCFISAAAMGSALSLKSLPIEEDFGPIFHTWSDENSELASARMNASSAKWHNGQWACTMDQPDTSADSECVRCPSCMDPSGTCLTEADMVFRVLPDCVKYSEDIPAKDNSLCLRSMYRCPGTGVLATLPLFSAEELDVLYTKYYHGQAKLSSVNDPRPVSQSSDILKYGQLQGKTGLTIVEMGAAAGYLLYNMRAQAANGGRLIAFEPGPDYADTLRVTLTAAKRSIPSLKGEVYTSLFRGNELLSNSVDVFMSSHVLEHWANPCDWLSEVKRILKPGGIVFTEMPIQYYNFQHDSTEATEFFLGTGGKVYEGEFHISLFGRHGQMDAYGQSALGSPYPDMMRLAGFEEVWSTPLSVATNRYIHRKPLA